MPGRLPSSPAATGAHLHVRLLGQELVHRGEGPRANWLHRCRCCCWSRRPPARRCLAPLWRGSTPAPVPLPVLASPVALAGLLSALPAVAVWSTLAVLAVAFTVPLTVSFPLCPPLALALTFTLALPVWVPAAAPPVLGVTRIPGGCCCSVPAAGRFTLPGQLSGTCVTGAAAGQLGVPRRVPTSVPVPFPVPVPVSV